MSGINKAIIVGRLGKDPETKTVSNGSMTLFTVATSESWVKDGEKQERTEWHRITTFGKLADVCAKYLVKGKQVYLEGRIETRKYEKDGVDHYATGIVADKVEFLGDSRKSDDAQPQTGATSTAFADKKLPNFAPGADGLPF